MMTHSRRLILALLLILAAGLSGCSGGAGKAAWNVLDYRLRRTFPPLLLRGDVDQPGGFSGQVSDDAGRPLAGALILVSTAEGQVFQTRSDEAGRYRLAETPAGRYAPLAAAWSYDATVLPMLRIEAGRERGGVDFVLSPHQAAPVEPLDLRIGPTRRYRSEFPTPLIASSTPFTFTLDGLTIGNNLIYRPDTAPDGPLPTLVAVYPSRAANWWATSIGLTRQGFAVLAIGPDGDRGLDIEGHARDFRAIVQLWQEGQLPSLPPTDDWLAMSGSFGSLILFRGLPDLPVQPLALVDVGGVSDAFLGVQSLYSERASLSIPPPYDSAVAALGRPDRDPAFFFAYSPVFFAEHLPLTFIIHSTNDEVIPSNQAEALDAALNASSRPHRLLIYEDTTHYLNANDPSPATFMVFDVVLGFAAEVLGPT